MPPIVYTHTGRDALDCIYRPRSPPERTPMSREVRPVALDWEHPLAACFSPAVSNASTFPSRPGRAAARNPHGRISFIYICGDSRKGGNPNAFGGRGGSLGKDFDSAHGCIALHRNEVQKQFALSVRFQARELANSHVRLARLFGEVEVLEEDISIAEHIEDVRDWSPVFSGWG